MVVMTSNSHRGGPGSTTQRSQIYSPLLPQNWCVEHEITRLCVADVSCLLQNEENWGCRNGVAGVCWQTVEDRWWFFANSCVEICCRWVHRQRGVGSVGRLLKAKSRSLRGACHLLAYMGSCLTICQTCLPCPPSGWVSHFFPYPLMIGLIVILLTFFLGVVSIALVLWELVLFYRIGVEFEGAIFSNYSRGVEWQQGVTAGIGLSVYNVLDWPLFHLRYCEHSVENQWRGWKAEAGSLIL